MDPKEAALLGGGALLVVGALYLSAQRGGSGQSSSGPSDAAVAAIEAANANATASANNLAASRTRDATTTILGLASLNAQQNIAGIQSATARHQVDVTTQAQVQQSEIQAKTTVDTASILARANEIIQQIVTTGSNYNAKIAGETAIAQTNTTAAAATTIGQAKSQADITAANDALNASHEKAQDGLWASVIGSVAKVFA